MYAQTLIILRKKNRRAVWSQLSRQVAALAAGIMPLNRKAVHSVVAVVRIFPGTDTLMVARVIDIHSQENIGRAAPPPVRELIN
ncbi:hypothetical protein L21_2107 [Methanoculleus chikugoensis]|uniref:Uncharacterized protein n=1 Tax=Methanoculleus chikugoensis TaxID=118126 RepID=A0A1M4MMN9_9EURY|nr:hypothetical protein L21_2107 [Methanoculleus chikugoensis]